MKKNNIILKASAGTGKTYRLSLEFIANLIRGVNYKNIVVMTFTKKATAEIKERIYDFLHQIAFDEGNGAELEKNLKEIYKFDDLNKKELQNIYFEMIRNKEDIRISTIDGFTNKIFKNAIAPYFNIYNYETLDEETDEFYSKILIKIIENENNFEDFKFIFDEKKEKKNIKRYMEIIKEILDMRPKFVLTKGFKMSEVKKVSYKFIDELDGIFEKIEEVANKKNKNVTDVLTKAFHNIYGKYSDLSKDESKNGNQKIKEKLELVVPEIDLFFEKKLWNGTQTKGEKNKDVREELETKSQELKEKLSEYVFIEKVLPLDKKLKNIAQKIFDIAKKIKISSKRLTHNDILVYTYEFIFNKDLKFVENDRVTEEFLELIGGKIDTIMIDEFQDTSILQWKILKLLMNTSENIICVGDEKQSIYNWRGGEKELFEKLETMIEGNVQNLDKSYRSYKAIIENVNKIFKGYDTKWNYVDSGYRDDEEYQKGYFGYFIRNTEEKTPKIYTKIVEMIENGQVKNLGKSAIICRTNPHLKEIAELLNKAKIPYTLESKATILEYKPIVPMYQLIKFFAFGNFKYLLEFMRSDLIGGLNNHVKYLLENKNDIMRFINGYQKIESSKETNKKQKNVNKDSKSISFKEFIDMQKDENVKEELLKYKEINVLERNNLIFEEILEKVRELKKLSKDLNNKYENENFSRKLVENFEITKYYSTNSDLKNIFIFFNILKKYNNLYEFITFIEEEKENLRQVSSRDVNAINLMTIHASKGLEFDTVFYYKRKSNKGNTDKSNLKSYLDFDEKFNDVKKFMLLFSGYDKKMIGNDLSKLIDKNIQKEEMEEINNDYVALTRAKKNLILLFDAEVTKEKGYTDPLAKRIIDVYKNENENEYETGQIVESEIPEETTDTSDVKISDSLFKTYFNDDKLRMEKSSNTLENEFKRKKGLAMHYYFEHILNDLENEKKIAKSALLSRYGNMLGEKIVEELIVRMDKFIEKNIDIYDKKYKVYNEFEVSDSEGKKRIIDRINIDENNRKIYIYDYKTGFEPETKKEYQEQIEEYKNILRGKVSEDYEIEVKLLEV
ncbi:MAG: UvrD-helicase domain-containing protein [Leptotrichia wadei]|uniref:UvrD-helicase domain-containing protein n=1 Tax=Leptotrichia wadei TaxID=157687 RepID=UPI0026F2E92D|nr:UvrD-helicase domain-containing protein [Leptotrichia wadei]MBS6019800.1 UvrD-helicase domain-containing protein [Leptotrichia wadei]